MSIRKSYKYAYSLLREIERIEAEIEWIESTPYFNSYLYFVLMLHKSHLESQLKAREISDYLACDFAKSSFGLREVQCEYADRNWFLKNLYPDDDLYDRAFNQFYPLSDIPF